MAQIQDSQLHDFSNGEIVTEQTLDQNFDVLQVAINDTDTKVNNISANGAINTVNLADGSVTTSKIAAGALDGRYYTETEMDVLLAAKVTKSGDSMTGALTLSGNPTNTNHAANKAYVDQAIASILNAPPETLNTLDEIAQALGDDPNFATTITNQLALKAPTENPNFTGTPQTSGNFNFNRNQALNIVIDKSTSVPSSPTEGQMWYDTVEKRLKVYRGAVKGWTNVSSKGAQIKQKVFTATSGQTVFDFTDVGVYEVGSHNVFVYKNKQLLTKTLDYSETSTTSITLTSGAVVGDIVDIIWFENDLEVITVKLNTTVNRTYQVSTEGQQVFTISGGYTIGLLDVYMNGIRLQLGTDYTALNGSTVSLSSAVPVGQEFEFVAFDYAGMGTGATSFNGRVGDIVLQQSDLTTAITGPLTLAANPTSALHAATKQYVDGIAKQIFSVKTSNYTAVSGDALFCDTSTSSFTLTLPSNPSDNDYVQITDAKGTFNLKNLLVNGNGKKVMGSTEVLAVDIRNTSFKLVFSTILNDWRMV